MTETRYCGACGEYYADGDVLESKDLEPAELLAMNGTECPTCIETAPTVDDIAEGQAEASAASFHDGGSTTWAMIERGRG